MNDDEALSRLLDGDLDPADADALQQRMAAEPALAARWEALRGLAARLDALSDPAPPAVRLPAPARPWGWVTWGAAWAAAAAALLMAWPTPPRVVLADGVSVIDGELAVWAGDWEVDVDGRAAITVEPPAGAARGGEANLEVPVDTRHLLAGLAGAVVTITVYEGRAVVRAPGQPEGVVTAGETRLFAPERPAPAAKSPPGPDRAAALQQRVRTLTAELDAIEAELATERFTGELIRGRLEAVEGVPSEWTADVPDTLRPERFEADMVAQIAALPDVELAEVDCVEYPCIVAFRYTGDDPTLAWGEEVVASVNTWAEASLEHADISVNRSVFSGDGTERRFITVGVSADAPDAVKQRTAVRLGELNDALSDEGG
jgi:ferric-dicitrate binding protein FerR (iron transport regulator)